MWPSLFDDAETKASFDRLRARYDERLAYLVAAVDGAYRNRVRTGFEPLEAYAKSVGEIARIAAIAEGYSPEEARERETAVCEKTLREGMDDRRLQNAASSAGRPRAWRSISRPPAAYWRGNCGEDIVATQHRKEVHHDQTFDPRGKPS
jgi:hypothetical protein